MEGYREEEEGFLPVFEINGEVASGFVSITSGYRDLGFFGASEDMM